MTPSLAFLEIRMQQLFNNCQNLRVQQNETSFGDPADPFFLVSCPDPFFYMHAKGKGMQKRKGLEN